VLGEFFDWWGRQLLDSVPARFRPGAGGGADALVADASEPGTLILRRRRRGAEQRLAQVRTDEPGGIALRAALAGRPRGEAVVLRLSAAQVLERAVTLPLAAERELDRVLGYEMERLTPFTAAELFWGYELLARDRARARLTLRLTMVPRAAVAALLALMSAAGGRPGQLETQAADGTRVMRLEHEAAPGRALRQRALAAAAAALAVLVVASPFLRQSLALADVDDRLDQMAPRIAQVDVLRRRIAGAGAGGDAVAAETRRLGDTLEALAAVTEILPDDSYLTEFTMRERKMTLSGLGASAPKLISLLSGDPRIRGPAFTAPVTRSETNHLDVFSIRAELAP
jgi:general secretion pathway protein L